MRAGGAFLALAVTLAIFGVIAWLSDGWAVPFAVTPAFLGICAAAVLFGAFATVNRAQKPSVAQVVALSVAVALIIASQFLANTALGFMGQHWLFMYAVLALVCALVLRRSIMPKA